MHFKIYAMLLNNYTQMLIAGLFGIIIYSFRKIKGMRRRPPANQFTWKTVFKTYWTEEWDTFIFALIVVGAAMFLSKEFLGISKEDAEVLGPWTRMAYKISAYVRILFFIIGYFANSIVDAFTGSTEKKLQQISNTIEDAKTNP